LIGIGSALKKARKELGFSLEEMQKKTNIQADYLQSLEEERFEQLPSPFYARGFLRAYAKSLRLDWKHLLDLYEQTLNEEQQSNSAGIVTKPKIPQQTSRTREPEKQSQTEQRLTMSNIETFVPRRELFRAKRRKKERLWWMVLSLSFIIFFSLVTAYIFYRYS